MPARPHLPQLVFPGSLVFAFATLAGVVLSLGGLKTGPFSRSCWKFVCNKIGHASCVSISAVLVCPSARSCIDIHEVLYLSDA